MAGEFPISSSPRDLVDYLTDVADVRRLWKKLEV